jgi:hypothetical protein
VCSVAISPTTVYTLFDGNDVVDEVIDNAIRSNRELIDGLLAKHNILPTEVDVIGG